MGVKLANNGIVELTSEGVLITEENKMPYEVPYIKIGATDLDSSQHTLKLKFRASKAVLKKESRLGNYEINLCYEISNQRRMEKLNQELCKRIDDCDVNINNSAESVINRLYKLHILKENGIVTDQEFLQKRNEIIESARH